MYTILEDCSPFYIRFTHVGIEEFCTAAYEIYKQYQWPEAPLVPKFVHGKMSQNHAESLFSMSPVANDIVLKKHRASFFVSKPGLKYPVHKDGIDHSVSINYTIKILDDKCVTSWYDENELRSYTLDPLKLREHISREILDFVKENHTPLKIMVAKQNECILFNTDIYHTWDNSLSDNERIVLTLRPDKHENFYFDDAKNVLFKGII